MAHSSQEKLHAANAAPAEPVYSEAPADISPPTADQDGPVILGDTGSPNARIAGLPAEGYPGQDLFGLDLPGSENSWHHEDPTAKRGNKWLITFADLMALLLCFFVLLFAISQLDVEKFRQIAQSMASALGGKAVIFVKTEGQDNRIIGEDPQTDMSGKFQRTYLYGEQLRSALNLEIDQRKLDVEVSGQLITIHILQHGSFQTGSATLSANFLPIARKIRDALVDIPGDLTVAGHTDNLPVTGGPFRSNWELSGARAFSVMHELLKENILPDRRFVLKGYAATHPRVPNDSEANRAKNRRVEIIIDQRGVTDRNKPEILARL